ncbi:hypothetical protein BsWGS_17080 [Bradybaena similaris]
MLGKIGAVLAGLCIGLWYFKDNKLDTIKGKRVLVTGASTGIGEQLAYQYARLGCHVVVTSRRLEALTKVIKRCQELSPENYTHYAVVGDMNNMDYAKIVIQEAVSFLGGLDILVLNHITPQPISSYKGSLENITLFDKVTDVNFRSYVHLTSYAMPQLIENAGSIVVVNSLLGKIPHPFLSMYSASKHALHGFFGSLRSQFISLNQDVSITMCTLGYIGTDNAIKELQNSGSGLMLKVVNPASPEDTARAIVTANARRDEELYYPSCSVRLMVLLRNAFPQTVDAFMRLLSLTKE